MSKREALRQEIEETRAAFHALLAAVPDAALHLPSDNPAWTVGEVLYHMSVAPRMLGRDAKMITGQNWAFRLIPLIVPKGLFNWLNQELTKYGARRLSREFLAEEYDKAHAMTLRMLAAVADSDFEKRVHYPDWDPLLSGEVTLEKLFHYVKAHFDSHEGQLRAIIHEFD